VTISQSLLAYPDLVSIAGGYIVSPLLSSCVAFPKILEHGVFGDRDIKGVIKSE
jgi:hypothetical protein